MPAVKKSGLERLAEYINGKKLLLLGYGREGKSSFQFLTSLLHSDFGGEKMDFSLSIADSKDISDEIKDRYEIIKIEDDYDFLSRFDLCLKSPGISFKNYAIERRRSGIFLKKYPRCEISGQSDLFLRFFSEDVEKFVGITGTKGKSTTTSLLFDMLRSWGKNAVLRGNIGIPLFEGISDLSADEYLCAEFSSHQLEFCGSSPKNAAITNFYPEHLDHYKSYDDYLEAKLNILRFQKEGDFFVLNSSDNELFKRALPLISGDFGIISNKSEACIFSASACRNRSKRCKYISLISSKKFSVYKRTKSDNEDQKFEKISEINESDLPFSLKGEGHLIDISIAFILAHFFGAPLSAIEKSIFGFRGLPHRCEFVANVKGVDYYNDSISTIPQSTLMALENVKNAGCLIVGGMDRGLDLSFLCDKLLEIKGLRLVCLPDTGSYIYNYFLKAGEGKRAYKEENMEAAVLRAYRVTAAGESVILSPAASSYNRYRSFEERGNDFKDAVNKLGQSLYPI